MTNFLKMKTRKYDLKKKITNFHIELDKKIWNVGWKMTEIFEIDSTYNHVLTFEQKKYEMKKKLTNF